MSDPEQGDDAKEQDGRAEQAPHQGELAGPPVEPGAGSAGPPAPLGILFLAAAIALVLLLTVVGLIAFAALTPRSPALLDESVRFGAGSA